MNFANSMTNFSQEKKRKYINTFVKPYCSYNPDSTDLVKEINIIKELKNNILKETNIQTHAIIDNYFNIITYEGNDYEYVNFYNTMNFCLVPLYIEPNNKSSER